MANMDYETLLRVADTFPEFYLDYLRKIDREAFEEHEEDLYSVIEDERDYYLAYYIRKNDLPIDKRFGYYVKNMVNKFPQRYHRSSHVYNNYREIPDNVTLNYKRPFINKVLIHKCWKDGDAESILLNGFKYGTNIDNLAWTFGKKNDGDYSFAYEFDYYSQNLRNILRYGSEGVVFVASGVMAQHHGDRKTNAEASPVECIFDLNSVTDIICRFKASYGYCEVYDRRNKLVFKKTCDPEYMLNWISNNLIRY